MKTAIIGLPMWARPACHILTRHSKPAPSELGTRFGVTKSPTPASTHWPRSTSRPKVTHACIEFVDFRSISKEPCRARLLASCVSPIPSHHVVRIFDDKAPPQGDVNP